MIIRKNSSKADIKLEIENLKDDIRIEKQYLHKIEVINARKIKQIKKELAWYVKRLADMQTLIKTK